MASASTWRWVGDRSLLWESAHASLMEANRAARSLHARLSEAGFDEVEDLVPAARTVLVVLRGGVELPAGLVVALERGGEDSARAAREPPLHEIQVAYGGSDGPDLGEVARRSGLGERDVVALHASASYTVGFLGFSPGFAYLLGLPEKLATPRLATPRTAVPRGSVGIGGEFTAVYPRATPGGWRLIGRSDVELFDVTGDPPALLSPGDRVRFIPR
jgi:5-oxoprolinase (ATP-hydrolysing) subunit B